MELSQYEAVCEMQLRKIPDLLWKYRNFSVDGDRDQYCVVSVVYLKVSAFLSKCLQISRNLFLLHIEMRN